MPKHYTDILKECGYPTNTLVVDFETYWDKEYTLSKMSCMEYVSHPKFEVLGVALKYTGEHGDSPAMFLHDDRLQSITWQHHTVIMQNAPFDALILAKHYGVYPPYIIDVKDLSHHYNARQRHSLSTLAKQYGMGEKGRTENFQYVHRDMPPAMWDRLSEYACNDAELEYSLFCKLLPYLSNPAMELWIAHHTLELWTKPSLMIDKDYATDLCNKMQQEEEKIVASTNHTREEISGNKSFLSMLTSAIVESGEKPDDYLKLDKNGNKLAALSKNDDERELLINHPNEAVRNLCQARIAIKSWPLHIKRIDSLLKQSGCNNDMLSVPLCYYGAHTGRFSGTESINLQNLGARNSNSLINNIKGCIVAPPGKKLVIVDASQIEARVLAWLAGQLDLCDAFAQGRDIYCEFASKILSVTIRKPNSDDPTDIAAYYKWARDNAGKVPILACGYGMGPDRLLDYAGGAIDRNLATKLVMEYRGTYHLIPVLWRNIETCFKLVIQYGTTQATNGICFDTDGKGLVFLTLPNGRRLYYHDVKSTGEGLRVYNGLNKAWEPTWGGSIVENIVQAISRDILCEAIRELELVNIHTVLHVHDEIVCVVDEHIADAALTVITHYMPDPPEWGAGLPLAAEGHIGERYSK
jgi:DNA polymerase bacteriophage-type